MSQQIVKSLDATLEIKQADGVLNTTTKSVREIPAGTDLAVLIEVPRDSYMYVLSIATGNTGDVTVLFPQGGGATLYTKGTNLKIPQSGWLRTPKAGVLRVISASRQISLVEWAKLLDGRGDAGPVTTGETNPPSGPDPKPKPAHVGKPQSPRT
jgi:hypothetical protein